MTLLCYSSSGVATNDITRVKNYDGAGSPGTLVASSDLITADPLYTKSVAWHFGGNRRHYGTALETTNQISESSVQEDFLADRLPMLSCKATNTYAALGAALPGSTIHTNLRNRGIEFKNWQDAHRGQGKWGATCMWMLDHELNGSGAQPPADWLAAMHNIIEIWKSVGVVLWDGENDFTTYTEGLMPGICLLGGKSANHDDMYAYWPDNDDWANQNLVFYAPDIYNGSANTRYWPPSTLFDPMRTRMQAKAASQALLHNDNYSRQGRPYLQVLYEHACAELPHFTSGAGTGTGGWSSVYGTTPYTKAFWQTEAAAYLEDQWPDLAALVYWDSNAGSGPGSVGESNFLDSSQSAWNAFVSTWASSDNFTGANDPLPSGTIPAPDVDSPTVLQSASIINSGVGGSVFNSSLFNIGPDELVLIWTEAERTDGVQPGIPTMSFPNAPISGTNPTLTRVSAADHQWLMTGTYRPQQGLWVASTVSSGPASGVGLRVTWPASVGGCTVVMERIVGADLAGAVSAAIVGSPVKVTTPAATAASLVLPNPANIRNRSFAFVGHRQNEPTNPGGSVPVAFSASPITPTANKLQVLIVLALALGGQSATLATVTGRGLTWQRVRADHSYGSHLEEVWVAVGSAPTSAPMAYTWNTDGINPISSGGYFEADIVECDNANIGNGGLNGIANVVIQNSAIDTGFSIPYAYVGGTSSRTISACILRGDGGIASLAVPSHPDPLYGPLSISTVPFGWVGTEIDSNEASQITPAASYGFGGPLQVHNYGAVVVEVASSPVLAEGTDVTRTSPGPIGIETAHSVGLFQANVTESWATSAAAGLMAIEVAAGPPASGVRLGSTDAHITTFETMLGRSVDSERITVQDSGSFVSWGSAGWATAAAADAAGRAVFVACYLGANTWAQIAAGNANAFLDTLGPNLAAFGQPGVFAYFPEPEANTGTRGTAAQFRSASTFVINRLRPLMPGWRFANVLLDLDWFGQAAFIGKPQSGLWNGTAPSNWIVPEAEILAVNAYNRKGAVVSTHPYANPAAATYADMPVALFADSFVATAAGQAKYLMLSEFGCAVDDPAVNPNGHTIRAAWIGSVMSYLKGKAEAVHYADLDSADGRINLRITGGVKAAEQDSVDAFKTGATANSITKFHTTTAIVKKLAILKAQTVTAILRKAATRSQSADAQISSSVRKTQSADAIVSKTDVLKTQRADAYITPYVLVTHVTSVTGSATSIVTVE